MYLAIAALLTALTCYFISFLVYKYAKNKFHKIWALFNLSIAGWSTFVCLASLSNDPHQSYLFWRISHSIGIFVSITFFHAVVLFCQTKRPILIPLAYFYGLFHDFMNFYRNGDLIYDGTKFLFNSINYLHARFPNFLLELALWIFLAFYGNWLLYKYSRKKNNPHARDAKLWFILSIFGYISGSFTFLPMHGINLYPLTLFYFPIYSLIYTYVIIRHNFFEINIVFEKSIIYSILLACISILYLTTVLIAERLTQNYIGYNSIFSILSGLCIGLLIIPFRNRIQTILDRSLFKLPINEMYLQNEFLRQETADKEKFKAVASLASGLAHEIRNPLTALKTFFEYFPQKKDDPEFMQKFAPIAGREVERIENLTKQLLDFAKPSPPQMVGCSADQICRDCLSLIEHDLKNHNITLKTEFKTAEYQLKADPNQLKQALLNILLNAVEAMPNGGELTVKTRVTGVEGQRVKVKLASPQPLKPFNPLTLEISIHDTGPGIAPQDLPHIFEPFYSKKEKGTGLGLAITQSIIEKHGGNITIKSSNAGTKFIIILNSDQKSL